MSACWWFDGVAWPRSVVEIVRLWIVNRKWKRNERRWNSRAVQTGVLVCSPLSLAYIGQSSVSSFNFFLLTNWNEWLRLLAEIRQMIRNAGWGGIGIRTKRCTHQFVHNDYAMHFVHGNMILLHRWGQCVQPELFDYRRQIRKWNLCFRARNILAMHFQCFIIKRNKIWLWLHCTRKRKLKQHFDLKHYFVVFRLCLKESRLHSN